MTIPHSLLHPSGKGWVCQRCQDDAPEATMCSTGECNRCQHWTFYPRFKLCQGCSEALQKCMVCKESVVA